MARLTPAMQEMIAQQQCFVATVGEDGWPNVGPKRSTRVLDAEHLAFNEVTGRHTYANLRRDPRVAVAVVDREHMDGYRFLGRAEVLEEGALFESAVRAAEERGAPRPRAVVRIRVEEIYSLQPPRAGSRVDAG